MTSVGITIDRLPIHERVLAALCEHPLLSRRQLELLLNCSDGWSRRALARLRERGWVQHYDGHQPWLDTRALFAPTNAGVKEAAQHCGLGMYDFCRLKALHSPRLERLAFILERVFQLRTILLWLARPSAAPQGEADSWRAVAWDVEIARFFSVKQMACWIPFHGAALFCRTHPGMNAEPRWIPAVIELDLGKLPVLSERRRLAQFVAAQDDARFWRKENELYFPVFVIIAENEFRLQDYYTLLRGHALARQMPMPRAYLTTFREALQLRRDAALPIWYSTVSSRRVPLLFDLAGNVGTLPAEMPWRKLPLVPVGAAVYKDKLKLCTPECAVRQETLWSNEPRRHICERSRELARLAFVLLPLEKRLLDEIAAHPLLGSKELELLLQASDRRVRPALRRLQGYGLIGQHRKRHLLTARGEQYLALSAGFGNAVKRYARARGWERGLETLLKYWEHTRAENEFFLHLAAIAAHRTHTLLWLSELEGRLYYETGNRRHSFLPDGRGTYLGGQRRYEFALEIDRSRASQKKIRRKFAEYAACVNSSVLRREGIEFLRVLFVTTSWQRAHRVHRIAAQVAGGVPIFITTFDQYRTEGADAAIWLRDNQSSSEGEAEPIKTHCFECFSSGSEQGEGD